MGTGHFSWDAKRRGPHGLPWTPTWGAGVQAERQLSDGRVHLLPRAPLRPWGDRSKWRVAGGRRQAWAPPTSPPPTPASSCKCRRIPCITPFLQVGKLRPGEGPWSRQGTVSAPHLQTLTPHPQPRPRTEVCSPATSLLSVPWESRWTGTSRRGDPLSDGEAWGGRAGGGAPGPRGRP